MTKTLDHTDAQCPRHGKSRGKRPRISFSHILGELLLTIGVLALLFAFYEAYWTNLEAGQKQEVAGTELDERWNQQRANPRQQLNPELGEAFARLYIPSFGSDFNFAVVEGTSEEDLLAGPGRYVNSQMPGEAGNFAVAGHRVGKGAPFNDLGNLNVCDAIVIETYDSWDVYRVMPMSTDAQSRQAEAAPCFNEAQVQRMSSGDYTYVQGRMITTPDHIEVTYPNPGIAETTDTTVAPDAESLITLTTCHPQFSNAQRMIVHGMLVEEIPKTEGSTPAVLESN
ncbi:class E sortase [Corynebacterium callunae]|uniref:class E sortase n=1 Tax=Corynebacterium callunae TaxID=1721 RepID=UPI001FFF4F28|nr:class E sortase [Corynebacterium callunae]MCK2199810.1 class E sortase [Corynebacterium callunae]